MTLYHGMPGGLLDFVYGDGIDRSRTMSDEQAKGEIMEESCLSSSQLSAHDPYDPRWAEVWEHTDGTEAGDQKAYKKVFGG